MLRGEEGRVSPLDRMPSSIQRKNWATGGHWTLDTGQAGYIRTQELAHNVLSTVGRWTEKLLKIRTSWEYEQWTRIVSICARHRPFPALLPPCQKLVVCIHSGLRRLKLKWKLLGEVSWYKERCWNARFRHGNVQWERCQADQIVYNLKGSECPQHYLVNVLSSQNQLYAM